MAPAFHLAIEGEVLGSAQLILDDLWSATTSRAGCDHSGALGRSGDATHSTGMSWPTWLGDEGLVRITRGPDHLDPPRLQFDDEHGIKRHEPPNRPDLFRLDVNDRGFASSFSGFLMARGEGHLRVDRQPKLGRALRSAYALRATADSLRENMKGGW